MEQTISTESAILEVVVRTLSEMAEQGAVDLGGAPVGTATPLFGEDGLLDSVGLVSFVIAVEQALADELEIEVGLADERALSQRSSPYRTVGSLAEYAASQVADG